MLRLNANRRRTSRRRALTLMEMMLVLAVVVAVAAMAAPAFKGVLDSQRLKKGGDHLRAEFAKAKNRAMRSGRIYIVRYQPGANVYYMQPWYSEEDALESSVPTSGMAVAGTSAFGPTAVGGAFVDPFSAPEAVDTLPEGVVFLGGDSFAESRDLDVEQDIAMSGGLGGIWSRPILFYPDGSSSNAQIVLQNQRQEMVTVSLRGLTGIATLSDVTSLNPVGL